MIDNQHYVYKKEIDWSTLHQGISIPISIQVVFQQNMERFMRRGESKDIYLMLEGKQYKVELVNQRFNTEKYPKRTDILQIRYNPQSEIACKIREIYSESYQYFLQQKRDEIVIYNISINRIKTDYDTVRLGGII